MNLADLPYHYSNIFWRTGLFNHDFIPGLRTKTIFFFISKTKGLLTLKEQAIIDLVILIISFTGQALKKKSIRGHMVSKSRGMERHER